MLRTDGNFEAALDRKLAKYLTALFNIEYDQAIVHDEMKCIIIAAMSDDKQVYYLIGEGDAILGDDLTELDGRD